jgi:hypothetical protein
LASSQSTDELRLETMVRVTVAWRSTYIDLSMENEVKVMHLHTSVAVLSVELTLDLECLQRQDNNTLIDPTARSPVCLAQVA